MHQELSSVPKSMAEIFTETRTGLIRVRHVEDFGRLKSIDNNAINREFYRTFMNLVLISGERAVSAI